jgi:DNA polymerase III alpha subunit (gram-positive type)
MKEWARALLGYDTETTGVKPDSRLIEFGAVLIEDGRVVTSWRILLEPDDVNWDDPKVAEALQINKLTREDLKGRKQYHEEFPNIKHALTQCNVRCAHNSKFDAMILRNEFRRAVEAGLLQKKDAAGAGGIITLDTLALDTYLNPNAPSHKLEAVAERWGVGTWQKHTAIGDADACIRILTRMSDHLPDDVHEVFEISKRMQKKREEKYAAQDAELSQEQRQLLLGDAR